MLNIVTILENFRGGLNSKAISCNVLVCCIILASRHSMLMYFILIMLFVFLLPLMLVNKDHFKNPEPQISTQSLSLVCGKTIP